MGGQTNIYSKIVREKTVKEKPAQTETENTEMYPLKSCVATIEYFIESSALRNVQNFSTYEWKHYVLQLVRVESCFRIRQSCTVENASRH